MPNLQEVKALLMKHGLSNKVASAIAGNFATETDNFKSLKPYDPNEHSYGYAHWNGPRLAAFRDYSAQNKLSMDSAEANIGYLMHELKQGQHVDPQLLAKMEAAPSVDEAAVMFRQKFERPRVANDRSRINYAKQAFNAGTEVAPATAPQGPSLTRQMGYQPPQQPALMQGETAGVPQDRPMEQHPTAPKAPGGKSFADMTPEERKKYIEDYQQFQNAVNPQVPYGYGDLSGAKMGLVGVSNPDYEHFQSFMSQAPEQLQSLMGMLVSGRLGGQQERKLPFGMRG